MPRSTDPSSVSPESVSGSVARSAADTARTAYPVLGAISVCHLLNDMMQSLLPAVYPILKANYGLGYLEVGLLTFTFQVTASLLQPLIGAYTDRRPQPYSLAIGMGFTLVGLLLLSQAGSFGALLVAAALVGSGSAVLHPESSRVARMAAGRRPGLAQSLFQVGGNVGTAIGPLLAAFIVLPNGQGSLAWFALAALTAMAVLAFVGRWYSVHGLARLARRPVQGDTGGPALARGKVVGGVAVLIALIFSKFFYTASMSSYYMFYLIERFEVSVRSAQIHLFVFLAAVAVGTVAGGALGDRFGRKRVIWVSILGALPFTLLLPHVSLAWTGVVSVPIGLIIASAFPAIVVYGQELMPYRVGTVAGLFFGLAFGLGGIGAAAIGYLADRHGIETVFGLCAFLPAIGLLAALLPRTDAVAADAGPAPTADLAAGSGG